MTATRAFGVLGYWEPEGFHLSITEFQEPALLSGWLDGHNPNRRSVKLLCARIESPRVFDDTNLGFAVPFSHDIVQQVVGDAEIYYNLAADPNGGATGLTTDDDPILRPRSKIFLQTPLDGNRFCSMALSQGDVVTTGLYCYDDEAFCPVKLLNNLDVDRISPWELRVETLPHQYLQLHCVHVSRRLAGAVVRVKDIEKVLAESPRAMQDIDSLIRTLHACNAELIDLERRALFESFILAAIQHVQRAEARHNSISLRLQQAACASRTFDFESLPRRIDNARATISNLIQQRNENLSLELTKSSFRIAEATLSDSKSMSTIAILTMILLPGTAVASFFSMDMFNWSAGDGSQIASNWLWIYFAVTIPLTGIILAVWWLWNRRSQQRRARIGYKVESAEDNLRGDEEDGIASSSLQPSDVHAGVAQEESSG